MGNRSSRTKLTQVAPSRSPASQRGSHGRRGTNRIPVHCASEPMQDSPEEEGSLGRRRTTELPPLRLEVPLTFSPLSAGTSNVTHSFRAAEWEWVLQVSQSEASGQGDLSSRVSSSVGSSIIRAHPPRRAQGLQPLTTPTAGILLEGTANHTVLETGRRGGAALHSPSHRQKGRCGTDGMAGVLEAQATLGRLCHNQRLAQRRAQRRQVQKLLQRADRGHHRRADCTGSDEGPDGEVKSHVRLVKRPAERDIFWDSSSGEGMDFGELAQPSPRLPEWEQAKTHPQHCSSSEELHWGQQRQVSPGRSDWKQAGSPRSRIRGQGRSDGAETLQRPTKPGLGKTKSWMLDWKIDQHCALSPRRVAGNREEVGAGLSDSPWEEEKRSRLGEREDWEPKPQGGGGRMHRRLTRTRPELIPTFESQLDLDF